MNEQQEEEIFSTNGQTTNIQEDYDDEMSDDSVDYYEQVALFFNHKVSTGPVQERFEQVAMNCKQHKRFHPNFYIQNSQSNTNIIRIEFLEATSDTTGECFAKTKLWTNESQPGRIFHCEQVFKHPKIEPEIATCRREKKFYIRFNGRQIWRPANLNKSRKPNQCNLLLIGNEINGKAMNREERRAEPSEKIGFETIFKNGKVVTYNNCE